MKQNAVARPEAAIKSQASQSGFSSLCCGRRFRGNSEAPQPAIAAVEIFVLKQPKGLWEAAFGRLSDEKPDLVRRFNGVLESETHPVTSSANVGQHGLPTQAQLSELIERKLARMKDRQWRLPLGKTSIEVRKQIDRILQIVLVAKDLGSSLASMDPIHAGIPWAGVCVLLPVRLTLRGTLQLLLILWT